jgi:hypothetical protein
MNSMKLAAIVDADGEQNLRMPNGRICYLLPGFEPDFKHVTRNR